MKSFTLVLLKGISKEQYKHRMLSFQTKKKIETFDSFENKE